MPPSSPLQLASVVVRSPDQVSGELDGRVVLLSVANGQYYSLNTVGSRIWALLERPQPVAALVERLRGEFAVEPDVCEREALEFLERLRRDRLLHLVEERS